MRKMDDADFSGVRIGSDALRKSGCVFVRDAVTIQPGDDAENRRPKAAFFDDPDAVGE